MKFRFAIHFVLLLIFWSYNFEAFAQQKQAFKVIAFFTGKNDKAHISFVKEAHRFFPETGKQMGFTYDSTSNWDNMNDQFMAQYQAVIFLDTRPDTPEQRAAFQRYMERGGGWIGFHFAAFALTPSAYPQNWDWYHDHFLGSGQYKSNTWRPTSAILKVENKASAFTRNLPDTFRTAPNEWYCWERDLKKNPDIEVLLSVDNASFPLGTGPKQHEIWHSGYYPVAWTNKKYRMLYINMGHNDIDYDNKTDKELSFTFANKTQNQFVIQSLMFLGAK
ncbi:ThuA domain-containing protein [Dyadobacter sp. CY343]|uniref:ThuA domain-containing protein n=1 Tax=Dyadobacter sp. CY343 TaxID=2907299 RepID=UPI001F2859EB|nr:ThuA domain-containing protein [Dyadobacter sp. CY343]MCE7060412.1 ThuA domain-containing protein [Dyadobacter sp. CY343]